jgi:hypothetical protein
MENDDLFVEKLTHALDLLRAEIASLRASIDHLRELTNTRLDDLEACQADHETRLRAVTEGVTQFKMFSGTASGGSILVSLWALIRTITGG